MKTIFKNFFLLLSLVLITSCDVSNDDAPGTCSSIVGVGTVSVNGPTTVAVNEEITLNVGFMVASNCGNFLKFVQSQESVNSLVITVNVAYTGCSCDGVSDTKIASYKFKAISAGVYTLKFRKTNTEFITHTVTVS